ncbi:acyltransferase [Acinetobacter sichuanensis]|uniref:acyltransferase n=1 Tax=Acinetobacter sichuanensis TaxID=2136183 RepID=UPI00280F8454|nr:acyltransferase [Acinetobacter sichuanensis]MDQ9022756.1 acyltransferase [Acinetobacter sichuanensis]
MLILKIMKLFFKFFSLFRTSFYNIIFKTNFKKIGNNVSLDISGNVVFGKGVTIESGVTIVVEKGALLEIGNNVFIGESVYIKCYGGQIKIGHDVSINSKSFLNGAGGLSIGSNTRIGTQSIMISSNHIFENETALIKDQGTSREGISIGEDVWFGARVTVLDGVNITNRVVVGACSLVNKTITESGVVVGIPAKIIKELNIEK